MMNNKNEPSMEDIMRIANSPAGKKLITLLQKSGGSAFDQAKRAAETGDFKQAKQNLSQIIRSPEIQALIKEMEQQNG